MGVLFLGTPSFYAVAYGNGFQWQEVNNVGLPSGSFSPDDNVRYLACLFAAQRCASS